MYVHVVYLGFLYLIVTYLCIYSLKLAFVCYTISEFKKSFTTFHKTAKII